MYTNYYSMHKEPFLNEPSAGLFFDSHIHGAGWSFLKSAVTSKEPYAMITGEYGSGKTLLCLKLIRALKLSQRRWPDTRQQPFVHISTPMQSYLELLRRINDVLELGPSGDDVDEETFHYRIYRHFDHAQKGSLLIIVDDAQELDAKTLNQVRLLSNYNADGYFPLRLFLFAHSNFRERLKSPDLAPLDQRIRRRYHLTGLNFTETKEYIYFRLLNSGASGSPYFPDDTVERITELTAGIPRWINNLCDMALMIGASRGIDRIEPPLLDEAATYLGWGMEPGSSGAEARPDIPRNPDPEAETATQQMEPPEPASRDEPASEPAPRDAPAPEPAPPRPRAQRGHYIESDEAVDLSASGLRGRTPFAADAGAARVVERDMNDRGEAAPETRNASGDQLARTWRFAVVVLSIAIIAAALIRTVDLSSLFG